MYTFPKSMNIFASSKKRYKNDGWWKPAYAGLIGFSKITAFFLSVVLINLDPFLVLFRSHSYSGDFMVFGDKEDIYFPNS